MDTVNQKIRLESSDVSLYIKREDLIDPVVSGNKFRKLKYNLIEAREQHFSKLLTFGGAFSNHIAAVAAAGKAQGFETVGIIRGEELKGKIAQNPTLQLAQHCGMQLEFVSRETYRHKNEAAFLEEIQKRFGPFYLIPEGGANALAVRGCEEILTATDQTFDYICCAVGTGGTIAGIINSSQPCQKVLGFPALKGNFLRDEICKFATNPNWELITAYDFGGYGKIDEELVRFMNEFYHQTGIPLDPVYTGKMVFGVIDLIRRGYFSEGSKILMIHTGGLQGIAGMNQELQRKKLPLIDTHG